MTTVWGNVLIFVFAHFVVSQTQHTCGKPTKYPYKQLLDRYLHKSVFGDKENVLYNCVRGYSYSGGSRKSQCKEGQWTTLNMKCQRKKCNALGDIENGRYFQEGQLFHDKAIAVCNEGYVLRGEKVRMCLENGWNGTDPICEESNLGSKIICSAPAVANQWVKPGERTQYTPQDTVTIICSEGFDLIGSSAVTCGPDGQWLNLPECRPKVIQCSAPSVENGRIHGFRGQYKPKDTVDVSCNEGFVLSGPPQVTCGPDGQWQGLPECHPKRIPATVIQCSAPSVENGRIHGFRGQYKPKDTVDVSCNEGFVLSGPPQVTCGPDGQWQGLPECHPKRIPATVIQCSAPSVENGRIHGFRGQYKPKDTVDVSCNEGFVLSGPPQVTCGPDGQWQGLPECRHKRISATGKCGPAPLPPNMELRDWSYMHKEHPSGSRIRYKCGVGHRRSRGSDSIRCQGGQWTKLLLRCERKRCGSAGEISYGRFEYTGVLFGHSAKAICQEGYELVGPQMRTCRDGGWDGRIPVCQPVHCPPPPVVKNAEMFEPTHDYVPFGRVVSYQCRSGALIGEREIYCTKKGTWSAPPPECKDIACPYPHVPGGSGMRGFRSVYKFGNTVTIACSPGLSLIGESFITCGPDGKWEPKLPECVRWNK